MKSTKSIIKSAITLIAVFFIFFVIGFNWRDVASAGFRPDAFRVALESTPSKVDALSGPTATEESLVLVRDTYNNTLHNIRDKFYPGASVMSTLVLKSPTNTLKGAVDNQLPSLDVKQLTYMAVRGIISALDDPFSSFMDPDDNKKMREENEGNFVGIGAQLWTNKKGEIYVMEPLPDTPAMKAGVKRGDVILKVDKKAVKGMDIDDVVKMIRGPENTRVTLTLQRRKSPAPVVISINRKLVDYRMVDSQMVDKVHGIGWVQLRQFNEKADDQMDKAMTALENQKMKGIILDMRGNPGGLLEVAAEIGSRFIKDGPVVIIQERGGQRSQLEVDPSKHDHKSIPLAVLIDASSASASEIVAGAIKDTHSGTIVGERSFGKGRVQTIFPLQGEAAVRLTTAKYLTPNGTDIHYEGIKPDYTVTMPDDIPEPDDTVDKNGPDRLKNDPQMRKAVEVLLQKIGVKTSSSSMPKR